MTLDANVNRTRCADRVRGGRPPSMVSAVTGSNEPGVVGLISRACAFVFPGLVLSLASCVPREGTPCLLEDNACTARADSLIEAASAWYTGTAGSVDDDRARALLEEASATGSPLATMWMARVFSRGRMGYEQDEERARRLATTVIEAIGLAAEQGRTEAQFLMGTAHDEGLGLPENPALAIPWFLRAAEKGHVLAAHNLGNAYAAGRGVTEDSERAMEWWSRAAEAGDAIPQLRLGEAYERGEMVAKDLDAARMWYERAASRGNATAAEALAGLPEG